MTTPDPLLERLRQLPRPALDDVAAARTLARAEAAFASDRDAGPVGRGRFSPPRRARAFVPAAPALRAPAVVSPLRSPCGGCSTRWALRASWRACIRLHRRSPRWRCTTAGP